MGEIAMGRFLSLALCMLIVSGCVPMARDATREEFGVSTARAPSNVATASAEETAKLDWKANQICVRGYDQTREDVEAAESDQQIIDMKLRCGHYDRLYFDFGRTGWSNLF